MVYAYQHISEEVLKIHRATCPNKKKSREGECIPSLTKAELVTDFLEEYGCFNSRRGDYKKKLTWLDKNTQSAVLRLCHMQYLHNRNIAPVFGVITCPVTVKEYGCGTVNRMWGSMEDTKSGKKRHMGPSTIERWSLAYTLTVTEEMWLTWQFAEANNPTDMFQNDNLRFHENLARQGANVGALQPGAPDRIFRARLRN